MVFQLTDELAEEILQALENQNESFVIDAKTQKLVPESQLQLDDDRFYRLPGWDSKKGFELREFFVNKLHGSEAQRPLKEILHSGRGVFRNFKNELKNFPEVERKWHLYKNRKMHSYIDEWYNGLREIWGLEKLDQDVEENDELIHDDFTFNEYDSSFQELIAQYADADGDFENNWPQEIQKAAKELWVSHFLKDRPEKLTGFICSTQSNDFAGCITAAPVSERTEDIVVLTSFFVLKKFRGLGIGTELLNMCLSELRSQKKKYVLLIDIIIPEELEPMLLRSGFEKTGSGYAAKLQ